MASFEDQFHRLACLSGMRMAIIINRELLCVNCRLNTIKNCLNLDKTKIVTFPCRSNIGIIFVKWAMLLVVQLDLYLTFKYHINNIPTKLIISIGIMHKFKYFLYRQKISKSCIFY